MSVAGLERMTNCSVLVLILVDYLAGLQEQHNALPYRATLVDNYVNRPISQTVFMLSNAINRAEHVCAAVIIKHNYMLMCYCNY